MSIEKSQRQFDCMGIPVTCSSRAALKQYDKTLYALVTVDPRLLTYADEALALDPSLVLVNCLLGCIWLSHLKSPADPKVAPHLEALKTASPYITDREKAHVKAAMTYSSRNIIGAVDEWMAILLHHPRDVLAISLLFVSCISIGAMEKMRDFLARLLPWWTESMTLYPYIISFYAFALEENRELRRAEALAKKALAMNPSAAWSYHALCHVIEEDQDVRVGVELLTSTRPKWISSPLGGHISWHLALFYLELGDIKSVLKEFDTVLYDKAVPDNLLGLVDAASLLWRLNVMGIDPGEKRWERVTSGFSVVAGYHVDSWHASHAMMSLAHGNVKETEARLATAEQMLKTFQDDWRTAQDSTLTDTLGIPLCTALLAFGKEQYEDVISLLLPLKSDMVKLGGSWAQRQVFSVTLIHAAIRSNQLSLALALIAELWALKPKNVSLGKLFKHVKRTYELQSSSKCLYPYP